MKKKDLKYTPYKKPKDFASGGIIAGKPLVVKVKGSDEWRSMGEFITPPNPYNPITPEEYRAEMLKIINYDYSMSFSEWLNYFNGVVEIAELLAIQLPPID